MTSEELLSFLETASSTVTHVLRPELPPGHAERAAGYLVRALDWMIAEVRSSEQIARNNLPKWRRLRSELFPNLDAEIDAADTGPRSEVQQLEQELSLIQEGLSDEHALSALSRACADPASRELAWFRSTASQACQMLSAFEDCVQPQKERGSELEVDANPEKLREQLSVYLHERFPELPENAVSDFRITPGGNCKLTALFRLPSNHHLPEHLVLRQDLAMSITGAQVRDEFPIIERVHSLGVPTPKPLLLETNTALLGGGFMLMTQVVNAKQGGAHFAKDRAQQNTVIGPQFGRDAARELARLHKLTANPDADAAAAARIYDDALEASYQKWKSLTPKPPHSFLMELGFAWLKSHPVSTNRPTCLIHGDYGVHNMMMDAAGRLAAILDWELAQEGDPAHDLAECRVLMTDDILSWEEFVQEYLAAGGDPLACEANAVDYQCIWLFVKIGVMHAEARNHYFSGHRTDSLMASIAGKEMDRTLLYLARALEIASHR